MIAPPLETPRVFRRATAADAAALSGLAQRAKAGWGYPAAWLAEWRPLLTLSSDDLATLDVVVAEDAAGVGGFYALARSGESTAWALEHLWVEPLFQRRGWGRRLLAHAIAAATAGGASVVRIESDPNAVPFYIKAGARRVGERLTTIAGTPRRLPLLEIPCSES